MVSWRDCQRLISGIASEDENRIRRDDDRRRRGHSVQGGAIGRDLPAVAGDRRIDEGVVDVAVEDLEPPPRAWET